MWWRKVIVKFIEFYLYIPVKLRDLLTRHNMWLRKVSNNMLTKIKGK